MLHKKAMADKTVGLYRLHYACQAKLTLNTILENMQERQKVLIPAQEVVVLP